MERHQPQLEEHRGSDTALEQLRASLVARHLGRDQANAVVNRVRDFYANAFGLLDFPPAIGIASPRGKKTLLFSLLWPAAISPSDRVVSEDRIREAFDRDLSGPLSSSLPCQLHFAEHDPAHAQDYTCYLGPSRWGYEALAQRFLTLAGAADRDPEVARQMKALIDTLPEKSDEDKRTIIEQLRDLATSLRSS